MMPNDFEPDMDEMPEGNPSPKPAMSGTQICVPATSLEAGEGEDKSAPEVGDSVDFAASGKVTRVEGGNIYLTVSTVNDQPISMHEEPDGDEEAQLEADVEKARQDPMMS